MIKELKNIVETLSVSRKYINTQIFDSLCRKVDLQPRGLREVFFEQSVLTIINTLPENLIEVIIDYLKEQTITGIYHSPKLFPDYSKKFEFLMVKKNKKIYLTQEISLSNQDDLQKYFNSYKLLITDQDDEIYLLQCLDSVELRSSNQAVLDKNGRTQYSNIYDGDIIRTWDKYKQEGSVYIAKIKGNYIHDIPYYKELIWSDKYGYFTPKGEVNEDTDRIVFEEGSLNLHGNYNDYCLRLKSNWEKIGNIYYDIDCLHPTPVTSE